jgi:hypothetical protein
MIARDCTQLFDAVQHSVFVLSEYLRSICTSALALWRPDGLTYLIAESCVANNFSREESGSRGDSNTLDQALAHMLLKRVVWITETIAPGTGQEKS